MLQGPPSIVSISMLHVHPFCMLVSMLHARVHALSMPILHVHAACPCPCPCSFCMPMLTLHAHAHTACPCSCCMPMPMLMSTVCCVPIDCITLEYVCSVLLRGCYQNSPPICCLPDGHDHGGDGQPPEGHSGEGQQEFRYQIKVMVEAGGDLLQWNDFISTSEHCQ
jgi:hypothetical protein